jgi:GR25 family glycosyltransferase involved in LPS biosynthesis
VKSINKHTPGTNIYIFDNSDKRPFVNIFNNVTVFDNTKGQIINFDQWLKKYPDRTKSGGKANNWGSAKHAYSVEKCMELIKEPFVLLDSDVLIKKDFSPLYDEIVCYKGEVIYQPNSKVKRVLPFICFINTPLCNKNGVHYFDENYMHGLHVGSIGDRYDTGAALYLLTEKKKAPHREIKVADYIVHYGNGSWVDAAEKMRKPKHIPATEWLNKYKDFWSNGETEKIESVSFDDAFDHIYCLHYLPATDRLQKIKNELVRVGIDEKADYFSWVYDYPTPLLDLVYNDKRLNMHSALKSSSRDYIKRVSMKHYQIVKEAYSLGYERILILEDDIRFHRDMNYISTMLQNIPDTDVVLLDKMVCSAPSEDIKYKRYVKTLPEDALYGDMNDSGVFFIFCSCYALNRKAMKHIIDAHESSLLPPDTPFNDKSLSGSFAIINLAIQDPKLKTRKTESYDRIGLNTGVYGTIDEDEKVAKKETQPVKPQKKAVVKLAPVQIKATHPKTVVRPQFKSNPNLHKKRKIEAVPINKAPLKKPLPKSKTPLVTQRATLEDKKKTTHIRTISAKASGYNKLYDV